MKLLRAGVVLAALAIAFAIALLFVRPPDHLASFRQDAVKEEWHFVSFSGKVIRLHTVFLGSVPPDEVKLALQRQFPKSAGWYWDDHEYVGQFNKGSASIVYVPTSVATQGTSEAPQNSTMILIEQQDLSPAQLMYERIVRLGKLNIEK